MTFKDPSLSNQNLKPGSIFQAAGLSGSAATFFLARLFLQNPRNFLVVTSDLKEAMAVQDDLHFFLGSKHQVRLILPIETPLYAGLSPAPDVLLDRVRELGHLSFSKAPTLFVAPLQALTRRTMPRKVFIDHCSFVNKGETFNRERWAMHLTRLGYSRVPLVEDRGNFAMRGGIVDIFSPAHDAPCRIELFGDVIESMRFFDSVTQKSIREITDLHVLPIHEILFSDLAEGWTKTLKTKCDDLEIEKPERDKIQEAFSQNISVNGMENLLPLFYPSPSSIFDYLPNDCLVCTYDQTNLLTQHEQELEAASHKRTECVSCEKIFEPKEIFLGRKDIEEWVGFFPVINFGNFTQGSHNPPSSPLTLRGDTRLPPLKVRGGGGELCNLEVSIESHDTLSRKLTANLSHEHALLPLIDELKARRANQSHIFLVASSPAQKERLKDLLQHYDVPLAVQNTETESSQSIQRALTNQPPSPFVHLVSGTLAKGFSWEDEKQWWMTDEEIFGKKSHRRTKQKSAGEVFSSFSEMVPGDYIVHQDHGIGIYRGLVNLPITARAVDQITGREAYQSGPAVLRDHSEQTNYGLLSNNTPNDFLLLEYLGGDKLYVPVHQLNRLYRYAAQEGAHPVLDKMGGATWKKVQEKVKIAARKLAGELLQIQAIRASAKGFSFSPRNEMFEEFEASFAFDETDDQQKAINDVIADMEDEKPMDRLVCGDVGYGKTEVALRAAFKAVLDHKQVAVLVPTTVLAFQHFETFKKRFSGYPVEIALLSRFQTNLEQKQILEKLKTGKLDIVIATHRLLSNDIQFRDLGLMVLDEEHHFGVAQKEKLKKLKSLVDVLTLSATPIPRTLNFALTGIRDLSLINTPPADRLAIRTYVTHFDTGTLREAIMNEIHRGGQIYFVHNRVQTIDSIKDKLARIVPEVKVEIAHGQMEEGKLEETMVRFMEGAFHILLCTTIIESGLDIPNANTIFINRADNFGLAQLYQLRGRVGRSFQRAFCYLLIPLDTPLSATARKRLSVIQRFTELGSGFKIASHDLEIRGAGNILGDEQSGHIAAIGYDMYVRLLEEAVMELKGGEVLEDIDPEIKLPVSATIPEDLVADTQVRLMLYKELSSAKSDEECLETRQAWQDRLGALPAPTENLIHLMRVKVLARYLKVTVLALQKDGFALKIHAQSPLPTYYFLEKVNKEPKKFALLPDGKFLVRAKTKSEEDILKQAYELLSVMKKNAG